MKQVLALSMAAAFALAACVSEDESVPPVPPGNATFKALFAPLGGIFPFPNDLFFSGSTDGTVNIPVQDPTDVSDYLVSMNALDGYSTTAPIVVSFNAAIDATSITAASVRLVNITNQLAPVPLTFGTAYTAAVSAAVDGTTQLMITPVAPLNPKSRYAVLVTTGITSGGTAAAADDAMQTLLTVHGEGVTPDGTPPPELAAVWGAINGLFDLANAFGVTDANIVMVASFGTQSTADVMTFVNTNATGGSSAGGSALIAAQVGTNKSLLDPTCPGTCNAAITNSADVYIGMISTPYYQSRTAPTTGHWHAMGGIEVTRYTVANNVPLVVTETLNFPIILAVPNGGVTGASVPNKPVAGWPIVVFQHGITGNRTNAIAAAQALAGAGFAVIAMDHPLHGLPAGHPLRVTPMGPFTITEPTFDLDVSNNTTGAPGADGVPDTSGQNYINLSSLLTSRDNLRQSAANIIRVAKTMQNLSYDGIAGGDFDVSRMHFIGHSLGAITGTVALGVNTNMQAATLGMPGGTIARLLRDSPTFGPRINAGLAANGVVAGTQLYEQFMQAAQTVVDSGDPINFATAANANHALHLIQVIGTGATTADQVIPNSATARLITALGLTRKFAVGAFANTEGYVNFVAGDHSSILNPSCTSIANTQPACSQATVEMQTEFATWMGSNGAAFSIANVGNVIQP